MQRSLITIVIPCCAASRRRLQTHTQPLQGKSIKYLTPDAVVSYINTHRLYSGD